MHEAPIDTTFSLAVPADEQHAAQRRLSDDQTTALELLFQCADVETDMILMNRYTSFYDVGPLSPPNQELISPRPLKAKLKNTRLCIQHQLAETRRLNQELFKALGTCSTFSNLTSSIDPKARYQPLVASPTTLQGSPQPLNSRQPQRGPYVTQEYQADLPAKIDCSYPSVYTNPSFTTKDVMFSRDSQGELTLQSPTGSFRQQFKADSRSQSFGCSLAGRHDTECLRLDQVS